MSAAIFRLVKTDECCGPGGQILDHVSMVSSSGNDGVVNGDSILR